MSDDFDDELGGAHTSDGQARPNISAGVEGENNAFNITADELRQGIERIEQLEAEKKDVADQIKEVYAEYKARGFDTKALRKIISIRKKDADALREENAIVQVYGTALGIDEDLL